MGSIALPASEIQVATLASFHVDGKAVPPALLRQEELVSEINGILETCEFSLRCENTQFWVTGENLVVQQGKSSYAVPATPKLLRMARMDLGTLQATARKATGVFRNDLVSPTAPAETLERINMIANRNSALRNAAIALTPALRGAVAVGAGIAIGASQFVAGVLGTTGVLFSLPGRFSHLKESAASRNEEEVITNVIDTSSALTYGAFGSAFSVFGLTTEGLVHNPALHAAVFPAVNFLCLAMYGLIAVSATRRLVQDCSFRKELDGKLGNVEDAFNWIQAQVTLTEDEILKIRMEHDDTTFKAACKTALEKKWIAFERRAGKAALEVVLSKNPNKIEVINAVRKGNTVEKAKQGLLLLIAILGIIATVLGIIFTGPIVPAVLFVVGAILWCYVDSKTLSQKFDKTMAELFHKPIFGIKIS